MKRTFETRQDYAKVRCSQCGWVSIELTTFAQTYELGKKVGPERMSWSGLKCKDCGSRSLKRIPMARSSKGSKTPCGRQLTLQPREKE